MERHGKMELEQIDRFTDVVLDVTDSHREIVIVIMTCDMTPDAT